MRKEFSTRTKTLAFQRANGRCEDCGMRLQPGKIAYDHINPDGLTGSNDLSNCNVLCLACHKQKTRGDVGDIARARRRHTVNIGAKTSRNPLPGRYIGTFASLDEAYTAYLDEAKNRYGDFSR